MRDRSIAIVWVAGVLVAAIVYSVGPDQFLADVFGAADQLAGAASMTRRLAR